MRFGSDTSTQMIELLLSAGWKSKSDFNCAHGRAMDGPGAEVEDALSSRDRLGFAMLQSIGNPREKIGGMDGFGEQHKLMTFSIGRGK